MIRKTTIPLILSILSLTYSPLTMADENKSTTVKTSATLNNSCKIVVDNISFGILASPLTAQKSNSSISIFCNKDTPYIIDMAYSGIYGLGNQQTYWSVTDYFNGGIPGTIISQFNMDGTKTGKIEMITTGYVDSYFRNNYGCSFVNNKCSHTTTAYVYGMMSGVTKGNKIAYSILTPGDDNKVWNKGQNSYSNIGIGEAQIISFNTQITPDKSTVLYPAADNYLDTVTASINY